MVGATPRLLYHALKCHLIQEIIQSIILGCQTPMQRSPGSAPVKNLEAGMKKASDVGGDEFYVALYE